MNRKIKELEYRKADVESVVRMDKKHAKRRVNEITKQFDSFSRNFEDALKQNEFLSIIEFSETIEKSFSKLKETMAELIERQSRIRLMEEFIEMMSE